MTDAQTVERVRAPTWPDDDVLLSRDEAPDLLARVGLGTTARTLTYWAARPDGPPYAQFVVSGAPGPRSGRGLGDQAGLEAGWGA